MLETGEDCDFEVGGDDDDGDGCQADCSVETGFECSPSNVCTPLCGNGVLDPGELCDEGDPALLMALDCTAPNNITVCNGDPIDYGCQADCTYDDPGSPGNDVGYCGDGTADAIEACDNGVANNDTLYDGCTTACELGPRCGDGIPNGPEECDAGAGTAPYGLGECTSACVDAPYCGDSLITNAETCDDGDNDPGDGCSADVCQVETGFICHQAGLDCVDETTCGNGSLESAFGEACDDGNQTGGDGCDATCSNIESGYQCTTLGALCRLECSVDGDCPADEYCDGTLCQDDVCMPEGELFCDGTDISLCASNGASSTVEISCNSPTAFTSICDDTSGEPVCTCGADWDCPQHMFCEVGECVGTGEAPDCTLPPSDITAVLPSVESHWGGEIRSDDDAFEGSADGSCVVDTDCDQASGYACNPSGECRIPAAFENYGHVLATPIVANLDDDNGDGLINEFDFPEILFVGYRFGGINSGGVVRAIHGGGPNKGKTFWAHCDHDTTWYGDNAGGTAPSCPSGDAVAEATSVVSVADLDRDGVPEVIFNTTDNGFGVLTNLGVPKSIKAYCPAETAYYNFNAASNDAGSGSCINNTSLSPANRPVFNVAEMDGVGLPEIMTGRRVFQFEVDPTEGLTMVAEFEGSERDGRQIDSVGAEFNPTCSADLNNSGVQELIAGGSAYALPAGPGGITRQRDCGVGDTSSFCLGDLDTLWHLPDVSAALNDIVADAQTYGYCAVADVWGSDFSNAPSPTNPLDGVPEVVLIAQGHVVVIDGITGEIIKNENLGGGSGGGAPNIDDFDGDGFPEVASALRDFLCVARPARDQCQLRSLDHHHPQAAVLSRDRWQQRPRSRRRLHRRWRLQCRCDVRRRWPMSVPAQRLAAGLG